MNSYHHYIIRIENFLVFLAAILIYYYFNLSWKTFFITFFIPDVGMLGYFFNKKIGAFTYNLTHNFILPIILGILFHSNFLLLSLSVIWISHVGFDRMLGFGLKSAEGFFITHLTLLKKIDC